MSHLRTIPAKIFHHVQTHPEQPSIFYRNLEATEPVSEQALSYGELWTQASGLSCHLDFLTPSDHVIIVMPLCPQLLVAHLAILLRGAVASIFTHPSEKIASNAYAEKLHHSVTAFHPRAVITTDSFLDEVRLATQDDRVEIVLFPDAGLSDVGSDEHWKTDSASSIAIVQYSSGSTGMQKAVALTHEMVIGQCDSYSRAIGLSHAGDRICSWLPLYHDMGLFTSWLMPVLQGVPVSLIDPFQWVKQPQSLFRLMTDTGGTLCWLPNFAFNLLAQRVGGELLEGIDLSDMRGFVNCSEPVSALSMERFLESFARVGVRSSALWTSYAMAENSFAVTSGTNGSALLHSVRLDPLALGNGEVRVSDSGGTAIVSCGVPIEGTEVSIVDRESGLPISGKIGEIALKSRYMLREYYKNPEMTAAAIDRDGWYHTGDLGFVHNENIYITGRKKDLLIVGGRNFYPQDIEGISDQIEGSIPGRSVALGMSDEKLGTERAILLLESRVSDDASKAQLSARVRKAVFDELDCPLADIRIVPHMWLLKTSSGKIARQPNLEKYLAEFPSQRAAADTSVISSKLDWGPMIGWSLVLSLAIYAAVLMHSLGTNQSWNIYMGF